MPNQTITIASIDSRSVNTRFGPKPVYDIVGTDGAKYNYGFEDPSKRGLAVGTTFTGFVNTDKYGMKVDPKSVSIGGTPVPPGSAPPSYATANSAGGQRKGAGAPFPVPIRDGSMAIIRQNSLTNAVNTVTNYDGSRYESLTEMVEAIIELAYIYADFSSGQREVQAAEQLKKSGASSLGDAIADGIEE